MLFLGRVIKTLKMELDHIRPILLYFKSIQNFSQQVALSQLFVPVFLEINLTYVGLEQAFLKLQSVLRGKYYHNYELMFLD